MDTAHQTATCRQHLPRVARGLVLSMLRPQLSISVFLYLADILGCPVPRSLRGLALRRLHARDAVSAVISVISADRRSRGCGGAHGIRRVAS